MAVSLSLSIETSSTASLPSSGRCMLPGQSITHVRLAILTTNVQYATPRENAPKIQTLTPSVLDALCIMTVSTDQCHIPMCHV